jgi:ribonuclease T2
MVMSSSRCVAVLAGALVTFLLAGKAGSVERDKPGVFDYYVLVLSWSPTYCLEEGNDRRDAQCGVDPSHAFALHGLWPQYQRGSPEDCYAGKRPWVPSHVIGEMRDIMPNKGLIIHEYLAHGTCAGVTPEDYYDTARALYDRIDVPERFEDPDIRRLLSPDEIESEFLAANDWLNADMIAVTCRGKNLLDIRVCFSRDLEPRECGVNENQARLCPAEEIAVPVP